MPLPGTIPGACGTVKRVTGDHSGASSPPGVGDTAETWTYHVPGRKRSPAVHDCWRGRSVDCSSAFRQNALGGWGSERVNWIRSAVEPGVVVQVIVGFPYVTRAAGADGGAAAAGSATTAASRQRVSVRASSVIGSPASRSA